MGGCCAKPRGGEKKRKALCGSSEGPSDRLAKGRDALPPSPAASAPPSPRHTPLHSLARLVHNKPASRTPPKTPTKARLRAPVKTKSPSKTPQKTASKGTTKSRSQPAPRKTVGERHALKSQTKDAPVRPAPSRTEPKSPALGPPLSSPSKGPTHSHRRSEGTSKSWAPGRDDSSTSSPSPTATSAQGSKASATPSGPTATKSSGTSSAQPSATPSGPASAESSSAQPSSLSRDQSETSQGSSSWSGSETTQGRSSGSRSESEALGAPAFPPVDSAKGTEVREYRVILPLRLEEVEKAMAWWDLKTYRRMVEDGKMTETLVGFRHQPPVTEKRYDFSSTAPAALRLLVPKSLLKVREEAVERFPFVSSSFTSESWPAERFQVLVRALAVPGDRGQLPNALRLPPELLRFRKVEHLSLADDHRLEPALREREGVEPKTLRLSDGRGPFPHCWERAFPSQDLVCLYSVVVFRLRFPVVGEKIRSVVMGGDASSLLVMSRRLVGDEAKWAPHSLVRLRAKVKDAADLLAAKVAKAHPPTSSHSSPAKP